MKKLLLPTDFSDVANNAFVYALELANTLDAEIITLHVYNLPQVDYIDAPVYLLDIYEITELSNFENFKHQIPLLRDLAEKHELGHIKISNVLESGNLTDSIHEISRKEQIDYIVMGTKGAEGLAATFLGSVAEKVMRHSQSVVLAVPGGCRFGGISNILFTTKYRREDHVLLNRVIELARVFKSHIDCLLVAAPDKAGQAPIEEWKAGIGYDDITFHVVLSEDVEGGILDFIESHHTDMLAMPIHHKGFFEGLFHTSLSKKLAFHVQIPILAVHD